MSSTASNTSSVGYQASTAPSSPTFVRVSGGSDESGEPVFVKGVQPITNEPVDDADSDHRADGDDSTPPPSTITTVPNGGKRDAAAILAQEKHEPKPCTVKRALRTAGLLICMLSALYGFLIGLGLMGESFKVLTGKSAGNLFRSVDHPLSGLVVGILVTVLLQSSSTSTSIVVGLVGSGVMPVSQAIFIIMGANIGTSVTSTIVAMGQVAHPLEYERAFGGGTVHDMFNFLSVLLLLPLEWIVSGIQGEGGPIYWLTDVLTKAMLGSSSDTFDSPIKFIVSPLVKLFLKADKKKLQALSFGEPELDTCLWKDPPVNSVPLVVAKINFTVCGDEGVYNSTMAAWEKQIVNGNLVKGGWFKDTSDGVAGGVCLALSLVILCLALLVLVWSLKKLLMGTALRLVRKAANLPGVLAILVGAGLTIMVQSSSITTSALTPLVGIGVLKLDKMLPLTLGANLGTTCTALLASLVLATAPAVQIALCHLFFNIFGILIWYPLPFMREVPLAAARWLGKAASAYRLAPVVYLLLAFFLLPLLLLAMSLLAASDNIGLSVFGWILLGLVALAIIVGLVVAWKKGLLARVRDHLNGRRDANLEAFLAAREAAEAKKEAEKSSTPIETL